MILSGFYLLNVTLKNVFEGFLRIGEIGKAHNMRNEMHDRLFYRRSWMVGQLYPLLDGTRDEVTYTSLMNAYFDEGKWDNVDKLHVEMTHLDMLIGIPRRDCLPDSVIYGVYININGLGKKVRTTETKETLLSYNYDYDLCFSMTTLKYCRTLVENCSDDEFKSLVKLVKNFCNWGFENAYDTMLKFNYKPDGIVYNLFIIEHCKRNNADKAYNMYKEMVHYGFACHMLTVFPLIKILKCKSMDNELHWVIQNVLRSCNLNDSEILKFLNEFDPDLHNKRALFNLLSEKAKDGLFLKFSYAPASA